MKHGKKRVIVFGIFDGVHKGHRSFFAQARNYGDELVVVVGRDEVCKKLKGKTPRFSEKERVKLVAVEPLVDKAVLGDPKLSTYSVLEQLNPNVICLGYDQQELKKDLQKWIEEESKGIKLVVAESYKPEIYRNSLIRRN